MSWLTIGKACFVQYLSVFRFIWLQGRNNETASRRKEKIVDIVHFALEGYQVISLKK